MELAGPSRAIIDRAVFTNLKRGIVRFVLSLLRALRVLRGENSHVPMRELASHSSRCLPT